MTNTAAYRSKRPVWRRNRISRKHWAVQHHTNLARTWVCLSNLSRSCRAVSERGTISLSTCLVFSQSGCFGPDLQAQMTWQLNPVMNQKLSGDTGFNSDRWVSDSRIGLKVAWVNYFVSYVTSSLNLFLDRCFKKWLNVERLEISEGMASCVKLKSRGQ